MYWFYYLTVYFYFNEIISVVIPELCIFFWIPASVADAVAVTPNGDNIFFASRTATFINGTAILLNNKPPDWVIIDSCAWDNFISAAMLLKVLLI